MGAVVQPSGTVTFLFTDVEDHTRLWDELPDVMPVSLARHDEILRAAVEQWGGFVFSTAGDSFSVAFDRVEAAIAAAIAAQVALRSERWPAGCELRVRMGLHTGEADERDGDYFGPAVIRAARLMSLGHGGQVLVSGATARLLEERSEYASMLRPLGEIVLRGLRLAERVHELRYAGLEQEFPPLTVLPTLRGLPSVADELIGRGDVVAWTVELLSDASLITLTGPGAVGKSRLSVEVGALADDRFGDGAWFVPLATVSDESSVPNAVAEVLGVQETAGRSLTDSIVAAPTLDQP